jgi:hypothetical protein
MFKVTREGIVEEGKIISLSEEDRKEIVDMFRSYQGFNFLSKDDGVWKPARSADRR